MSALDEEKTRMYRIHRTLMEMLDDRGYTVTNFELRRTEQQFIEQFGGNLRGDIRRAKRDNDSDQIVVLFTEVLDIDTVRGAVNMTTAEGVRTVIFVIQNKVTPMAEKECKFSVNLRFELFKESELLFNITMHKLVPEHELLTDDQKKTLLEKYTLKTTQLPRIQEADPVARYYGFRRGQVVKITRPSETAGKYITYRYVT